MFAPVCEHSELKLTDDCLAHFVFVDLRREHLNTISKALVCRNSYVLINIQNIDLVSSTYQPSRFSKLTAPQLVENILSFSKRFLHQNGTMLALCSSFDEAAEIKGLAEQDRFR